jgi:hypothetical protein
MGRRARLKQRRLAHPEPFREPPHVEGGGWGAGPASDVTKRSDTRVWGNPYVIRRGIFYIQASSKAPATGGGRGLISAQCSPLFGLETIADIWSVFLDQLTY